MEIVVLGRPGYKSIKLQTRRGHDIDNNQDCDFSLTQNIPDYSKDYPAVTLRNDPSPFYNCYGMTFACARTMIGPESIPMILNDDGYTEISREDALPGDIIIYYDNNGEILHTGIIVSRPSDNSLNYPWVVSKWGMLSEVCHLAYDCPYKPFSKLSYWRITK